MKSCCFQLHSQVCVDYTRAHLDLQLTFGRVLATLLLSFTLETYEHVSYLRAFIYTTSSHSSREHAQMQTVLALASDRHMTPFFHMEKEQQC